jgi:ribonuclease D
LAEPSLVVDDARRDIEIAIRNRRASETGSGWSKVESFSRRRNARVRSAWEVARRREEKAAAKTIERANVTTERVLEAIGRLDPGQFQARDVAIALMSELADTDYPGRQKVIAHVGMVMRKLAARASSNSTSPSTTAEAVFRAVGTR